MGASSGKGVYSIYDSESYAAMDAYSFVEFVEVIYILSFQCLLLSKRQKGYSMCGRECFVSYLSFLVLFMRKAINTSWIHITVWRALHRLFKPHGCLLVCRVCRSYFYFILSFKETERPHSHRVVFCISSFLSHSMNL